MTTSRAPFLANIAFALTTAFSQVAGGATFVEVNEATHEGDKSTFNLGLTQALKVPYTKEDVVFYLKGRKPETPDKCVHSNPRPDQIDLSMGLSVSVTVSGVSKADHKKILETGCATVPKTAIDAISGSSSDSVPASYPFPGR